MAIVALFVGMIFIKTVPDTPVSKSCRECMPASLCFVRNEVTHSVTMDSANTCADIDNFFADGDVSTERLARMQYYVQQLEYEMYRNRPTVFNTFRKIFKSAYVEVTELVVDFVRNVNSVFFLDVLRLSEPLSYRKLGRDLCEGGLCE